MTCVYICGEKLQKIGDYEYPNLGTFDDALAVAKEAIDKYGGIIPNEKAAEKIGYTIKDPTKISGPIYERLGDLSKFSLFTKIRGGYQVTELAEKVLDPYNTQRAEQGKMEAIRKLPIVSKAFTDWKGEIPPETAFSAKLQALVEGISWQEAQKHAESLRKLFIELFPYLRTTSMVSFDSPLGESGGDSKMGGTDLKSSFQIREAQVIGELRTEEYGIIKIKDKTSIAMAKMALDSIERKIAEKEEEQKAEQD